MNTAAGATRTRRPRAAARTTAKAAAGGDAAKPKAARARRAAGPVAAPFASPAPVPVESPVAPLAPEFNKEPVPSAKVAPSGPPQVISDDEIRIRAYFLSIEHRGQGSPEYFWHLAERELRGHQR